MLLDQLVKRALLVSVTSRQNASDAYARKLAAAKRQSPLQLLFKASRLMNEVALARTAQRGKAPLRASHTQLLPHIALTGTRLSDLAERLGISKQATGQLVDDLEALGALERIADPSDGRAKLIRFTALGQEQLLDGLRLLGELERELEKDLGKPQLTALGRALERLIAFAERRLESRGGG